MTADACVRAAAAAAPGLAEGSWFFDLNSASPGHKCEAAGIVQSVGARYVEAALMSPIAPRRLQSPVLLGGPDAEAFASVAAGFGLQQVTPVSTEVGRAAATKLCRSVVVKGLEALLTEALLTARRLGVERDVLDSLPNILPPADWEAVAGYFISRSLEHGTRRAEEMVEAAATVAEAGLEPVMAQATVTRQRLASSSGPPPAAHSAILPDRRPATTSCGRPSRGSSTATGTPRRHRRRTAPGARTRCRPSLRVARRRPGR